MEILAPLDHTDLRDGGEYLKMVVCRKQHMTFDHYRIFGKPYARFPGHGGVVWFIRAKHTLLRTGCVFEEEASLADMGCPVPPAHYHNLHRVFHDTPQARKTLGRLVASRDLKTYCALIDQEYPVQAFGEMRADTTGMGLRLN